MHIAVSHDQYLNVFTATGIATTHKVRVQNTSSEPLYVIFSPSQPLPTELGEIIEPTEYSEGYLGVLWVKSYGDGDSTVSSDVNPADSVAEVDTTATVITGGTLVGGALLSKVDRERLNLIDGDVVISTYPNETLTFACKSEGATHVNVFLRTIEEFSEKWPA